MISRSAASRSGSAANDRRIRSTPAVALSGPAIAADHLTHFFAFSPISTSRRMASGRVRSGSFCFFIHASIAADWSGNSRRCTRFCSGRRSPSRFSRTRYCIGHEYRVPENERGEVRAFRLGSNPSHKDAFHMTQADRVRSTPPLNTSVSLSRRHMLAGVAVTTALPTAAIAATTAEPDPIFAAIAASREAQNEADRLSPGVAELNKEARAKFGSGRQHYDDCCAYVADILGVDQDEYTAGAFRRRLGCPPGICRNRADHAGGSVGQSDPTR